MRHISVTKTILKEEILPNAKKIQGNKDRKEKEVSFEKCFPGISKLKPCKNAFFADYFSTDGVSVSLLFKKPETFPVSTRARAKDTKNTKVLSLLRDKICKVYFDR